MTTEQVVERVEAFDWVGRSRFVTRYTYHHGYFDGAEREFRGSGRVDQWDTEEHRDDTAFAEGASTNWDLASLLPPVLTRTWFHTGAFSDAGIVSRQFASEYWPEAMQTADSIVPQSLDASDMREAYRALGASAVSSEGEPVVLVIGDLSFFHDLNGLLAARLHRLGRGPWRRPELHGNDGRDDQHQEQRQFLDEWSEPR